ncbi:MAG: peptide chain release factor 2, partial [Maritalea sp.]
DIGWGHQIRSYVLQPYQMVKDLRTGVESTQPADVLDGDLDQFMEAALALRVGKDDE